MAFSSLFSFYLFSLTFAATRLQSSDHSLMFAALGESVSLPCGLPSIIPCSSVSWKRPETVTEVMKAGVVTEMFIHRFGLLQDCSLKIHHLELNDAQLYSCESGGLSSEVSLKILQITEKQTARANELELHCSLNTYKGYNACKNRRMNTTWITEDNKLLEGDRFTPEYVSECFSKLIIRKKLTDHRRKWRCQLSQNDTVKSSTSYTTEVEDGLEEVFAAVGESVSLSCGDTSSLGVGGKVEWKMESQKPIPDVSHDKQQTRAFHVTEDSSLEINKVSPLHAGDYHCSVSHKVLNKIRLHTLDVTSESNPGGGNLTLTCVLTCSNECEKDFSLTWSGSGPNSIQSSLMYVNNTLKKSLKVSSLSMASDELICTVQRDGELMTSKRWYTVNTLQTPAWLALPLGLLLVLLGVGGLFMCFKRKHNKDAGNEPLSIGMTHIYEGIEDDSHEEQQQKRNPKREAATTGDSFYDLLQAVS